MRHNLAGRRHPTAVRRREPIPAAGGAPCSPREGAVSVRRHPSGSRPAGVREAYERRPLRSGAADAAASLREASPPMRRPSGPSSVACDVLSVRSVQNCAEPVPMDRLDCPEREDPSPRSGEKIIPTGRRKFFSANRAKHFFHQAAEKITWSGRPKYHPEKRTQKAPPTSRGKSFLKQKNLSLHRKTSP